MAMYLFASRISAAVCVRTTPSSPTHAPTAPWPDGPSSTSGRPVCLLQPRKNKSQKKVVLAETAADVTQDPETPACSSRSQPFNNPPPSYNEPDPVEPLVCEDGHLVAGSLEALTAMLVPTADSYPDRGFLFAFLLCSRLFVRPHELLGQVLAACHAQQANYDKPSTAKERLERLMPPMVRLLEEWTDMFPYDFRDERMMAAVRGITQGCECVPRVCDDVTSLLRTLLDRLTRLEQFELQLAGLEPQATTHELTQLPATDATEVCGSAAVLAQQLTGLELERMSYIGPEEFLVAFMRETSHSLFQGKKTNNLESYVAWSCHLSQLVATEICKQAVKKNRVRVTEFWIETAKECFNIGNFNSLAAILSGLKLAPVSRLSKTWTKAGMERLAVLRQAMDSSGDYDNYRATLKAAIWRAVGSTSASSSLNIVIPLFALFVKDLYGLADTCATKLPCGHVNMEAVWQLAKSVTDFISWQQTVSPFSRCAKTLAYLQTTPVLSEKALMLASFECELPETPCEKEHYITLKPA